MKTVNGVNRLSGDGLEAKDVPGMMQGGGKWPGRYCRTFVITCAIPVNMLHYRGRQQIL